MFNVLFKVTKLDTKYTKLNYLMFDGAIIFPFCYHVKAYTGWRAKASK